MSGAFLKLAIFLRLLLTVPPACKSAMMLAVADRGSIVKREGVVIKATEVEVCLANPDKSAIGEHGGRRGALELRIVQISRCTS